MAKVDDGFKQSEKMLNELEARIHKEYAQAAKELADKAEKYFAKFAKEDEEQRALYENGEITKKEYGEWRQRKMLRGKQFTDIRDTLAKDLTNVDKIAMKYVDDRAIDVYALNMNYGTYNIEHDSNIDTSFSLYNHDAVERLIKKNPDLLPQPKVDIPLDMKWNMQHIQSAITQSILQGESIPKVAQRLQRVAQMDNNSAIRNARTAITGAQNGGRLDSMERAKERGVDVKKAWMATLDDRTRDSHVELDGEEREVDEEFSNGLMFPGDPDGEPGEVYNCRCRMIHVYPKHPVDWSDLDNRNTDNLGDMTYEEWKNKHKEAEEITDKAPDENYEFIKNFIKQSYNLEYREVKDLDEDLSEDAIIEKLGGGDLTSGSCSSLTYAYIGNKCGYDVTDYRGGDSRSCFSYRQNTDKINAFQGVKTEVYMLKKEASDAAKQLKELDLPLDKEYRLSVGKHAAIIRNTKDGYEYLELQSVNNNGWHKFEEKLVASWAKNDKGEYYLKQEKVACSMSDTFYNRFGCRKTADKSKYSGTVFEKQMRLTEVDSFKGNENFKDILGYINTATDKQKKGEKGHER